jgi:hypothetical protein
MSGSSEDTGETLGNSGETSVSGRSRPSPSPNPPPHKKPKGNRDSEMDETILKSLQAIQERRKTRDSESLFGEQVAARLRSFDARKREFLKIKIMSLMFDAEFPDPEN